MKEGTRRYMRFGIRSLLVITLISALPSAWIAAKRAQWGQEESALKAMSPHVTHVERTYGGPVWLYRLGLRPSFMFRVDYLDFSGCPPGTVDDGMLEHGTLDDGMLATLAPRIAQLSYLRELHPETTRITDASAPTIARFRHVEFLNLQDDELSDKTVHELMERMPNTKISFFYGEGSYDTLLGVTLIPTTSGSSPSGYLSR